MELIKDRLPSPLINQFHASYRTIAMSLIPEQGFKVLFDDGRISPQSDVLWSNNLYFIWLLTDFAKFADSLKKPWMIVNGDTQQFSKLTLEEKELEHIQKNGLHVFLYEPLFFLNEDKTWPWVRGQRPNISDLDEISEFQKKLNAPVTVFLCEYGMSDYLRNNHFFGNLKFQDFSTLLMHEIRLNAIQSWPLKSFEDIESPVLCLNFRYEPTREMLVAFLRANNRIKGNFVSFFHSHDEETFLKRLPFNPRELNSWPRIAQGISQMQNELPYRVDTKDPVVMKPIEGTIPDITGHNTRNFWWLKEFMSKSFAFTYCESRPFSPSSEISEKTIHPILSLRPFVVYAAPYFLKSLKNLGFKTFGDFWDESYDQLEDPQKRFDAFLETVDFIASQDLTTLKKWGEKITPIVEHNRLHMMQNFIPQETKHLNQELIK